MRMTTIRSGLLFAILAALHAWPASAQTAQGAGTPLAAAPGDQVRRLTVDEALRLAVENNLGIQIARFNPQIQDLAVALARTAWAPTGTTTVVVVSYGSTHGRYRRDSATLKAQTSQVSSTKIEK